MNVSRLPSDLSLNTIPYHLHIWIVMCFKFHVIKFKDLNIFRLGFIYIYF
jgi:hypothetical protein